VSVSVSGATSPPINTQPINRPAINDRLAALQQRVDTLQLREAMDRQNLRIIVSAINDTNQDVTNLQNEMPCFDGGYQAAWDADGHLVANNDEPSTSNFVIPVTGAECGS
jgi:hypothetical protein